MKTIPKFAFSFLAISLLASCAGTKKIDFNTAYKFSKYNYNKVKVEEIPEDKDSQSAKTLYASRVQAIEEDLDEKLTTVEEKLYQKIGVSMEDGKSMKTEQLAKKFKKLDGKEKRELRRDIKAELKYLKNLEANNAYSVHDIDQINAHSDYTRLAIIIGSVGLILLVLGAVFGAGFLSFAGAIAIVGAAVLFIIDQA